MPEALDLNKSDEVKEARKRDHVSCEKVMEYQESRAKRLRQAEDEVIEKEAVVKDGIKQDSHPSDSGPSKEEDKGSRGLRRQLEIGPS